MGGSEGPLRSPRVGGVCVDIDYNPVLHLSRPYRCPIHKPSHGAGTPDAGTTKGVIFMAETTIARQLHELKERYHHELLNEDERLELLEAVKRLKRKLAAAAG